MFTQNYLNYKHDRFMCTNTSSAEMIELVNPGGGTFSAYTSRACYGDLGGWMGYGRCCDIATVKNTETNGFLEINPGVYFGTGSTPAKKTDYTLESPITSGLSIVSPSVVKEIKSGDVYTFSSIFHVKNTTESELNIWEIGIFTPIERYTNEYYLALMERTVLSEPITIPPGEWKCVTYKITFNQTLNVE